MYVINIKRKDEIKIVFFFFVYVYKASGVSRVYVFANEGLCSALWNVIA